jgi:hypothetical protein
MKNLFRISILVLAIGLGANFASASSAESAHVIRADKVNYDLMIERQNGELWILQHNPLCSTMSTEFPVYLILNGGKITQLKVTSNEICKVYNSFRYDGEALMATRILSNNELRPESQAEIVWLGKRYRVDYAKGCLDIREMVGKNVYLNLVGKTLEGGSVQLANNRGKCPITKVSEIGVEKADPVVAPPKLDGLEFQAQNNQVYFYWNPVSGDKPLYLISYSRLKVNTDLYPWKSMPNLKYTKANSYTVTQLANGLSYYFYMAALSKDNVPGPWTEVVAKPISPGGLKNNPDKEPFEVNVTEEKDSFKLVWPAKDTIRKFRISLYVGGKLVDSSLVKDTVLEYAVPKKPEYRGKGMRFTVRSMNKSAYDPSYFDGVYWEYKAKP